MFGFQPFTPQRRVQPQQPNGGTVSLPMPIGFGSDKRGDGTHDPMLRGPGVASTPNIQDQVGAFGEYQPYPLPMAPQPLTNLYGGMPGQYQGPSPPLTQQQFGQRLQEMAKMLSNPMARYGPGKLNSDAVARGLPEPQQAFGQQGMMDPALQAPFLNPAFQKLSPELQQRYLLQHMFPRDVNGRMPGMWDYRPPQQQQYRPAQPAAF